MNKAAAAILVANFNISRTSTSTISESDVSRLRRTRSEITGKAKPPPPKVSPRNRERKLTHTGVVQQKDIDSTPRSVKKFEIVEEGTKNAMVFTNQIVNSEPIDADQAKVMEHPVSPKSG